MAFDIYGHTLRSGHCEVHPDVAEPYPCYYCRSEQQPVECCASGRCEVCSPPPDRHPLTPADPHPHAWADLGTPGLHGSVCRLCGETQID